MESSYKILTKREVIDKTDLTCPICGYTHWMSGCVIELFASPDVRLLRCNKCNTLVGIPHIINKNREILYY